MWVLVPGLFFIEMVDLRSVNINPDQKLLSGNDGILPVLPHSNLSPAHCIVPYPGPP